MQLEELRLARTGCSHAGGLVAANPALPPLTLPGLSSSYTAPHHTAPHRTAPHRTASHRIASPRPAPPHTTPPHHTTPHHTTPQHRHDIATLPPRLSFALLFTPHIHTFHSQVQLPWQSSPVSISSCNSLTWRATPLLETGKVGCWPTLTTPTSSTLTIFDYLGGQHPTLPQH